MTSSALLLPFLALFLFTSQSSAASSVIDYSSLTPEAFKAEVATQELILVEFFAPWCGHCKRLAPEYEEAAKVLSRDDPPIPIAKVDCTSEDGGKDICSKNDVSGFPTLKIFTSGQSTEYDSGRDSDSIVKKMRSLAGPASKEIKSFAKAQEIYSAGKTVTVFGFFKNAEDPLYKDFSATASANRELANFVHIFEDSAEDKFEKLTAFKADKTVQVPSIVLARQAVYRSKFEPDYLVFNNSDALKDWIVENIHGIVRARDPSNAREIQPPYVVVYYNVDYDKDPKGTNYWRNRVLKVATKHKDSELTFTISNINQLSGELADYGLSFSRYNSEHAPLVAAVNKDGKKFFLKEKFSVDSFGKFVDAFIEGTAEQFLKSEEEPEGNESAGVKVAVGKNFDSLVIDSDKDIFIKFYAPWCGHCKSLAPTWDELGEKLKDEPGVNIVKLDATANDIPDLFNVRGFPTIYWYPKGTKQPVKYEGGRSIDDLLGYVSKQATDELVGYDRSGAEKKKDEL